MAAAAFSVCEETPLQPEIAALLAHSDAVAAALYPGEYRKNLNPRTLAVGGVHLLVARDGTGVAAGCCALFEQGDGSVELKRMIVGDAFRRMGAGAALLRGAEAFAVAAGMRSIRLEVGVRNVDGQALYRRAGFTPRGPFGGYQASPISLFFEKQLDGQSVAT